MREKRPRKGGKKRKTVYSHVPCRRTDVLLFDREPIKRGL